ncbi:dipeptidase [Gudongella sp. DL1XJH-153]|uniref:dipeptidase n=1 Tax=Gudongella sp. DL1XJH-153 TaxID=3409804 RepID=UPI003BB5FB2E
MKKIWIIILTGVLIISFATAQETNTGIRNSLKLHIDSVIVDSHNDTMLRIINENSWLPERDIRKRTELHADLVKLRAGNISVPFFAAYSSPFYGQPEKSLSRTLAIFNALYWTEKNNPDILSISSTYEEIQETVLERRIAAVPSIEGAYSITSENGEALLLQYRDLGVKAIGFTWNYSNDLGEGLYGSYGDYRGTQSQRGLTELGVELLSQMNYLGILMDVSHLSESSFWDVMDNTRNPIIASHSGAYGVTPHPRNLTDLQIRAIGENGGVIGVVYHKEFIGKLHNAYVKDIVDHMDYIINLIGVDHVGLGSDFDGAYLPVDLEDASKTYRITEELVKRGYGDREIKKILGLNILRVIKENDRLAQETRKNEDITITPDFKMGEGFEDKKPVFSATIRGNLKDLETCIIVNGIRYPVDIENSKMEYIPEENLNEKFYLVTFAAVNSDRGESRETRIVYIE